MSGTLPAPLVFLTAYVAGSIPFALLVARAVAGIDIRTVGSGNVGATNVGRAIGRKWFIAVFVLDAAKGVLPVLLLAPLAAPLSSGDPIQGAAEVGCALAAVLGHVFSVFLRFRGGKGVATTAGALFAISPLAALGTLLVFLAFFLAFRYVSLGSVAGALAFPGLALWLDARPVVHGFAIAVALLVVARHHTNLRRLLAGTEPRIPLRRPPKPGGGSP
jgi:glycerol-3-phosphate acyltransferase PlsY